MSRTKHHRLQKKRNYGKDFGAKYNCDKGYGAGTGRDAKNLADKERRNKGKRIIRKEILSKECFTSVDDFMTELSEEIGPIFYDELAIARKWIKVRLKRAKK